MFGIMQQVGWATLLCSSWLSTGNVTGLSHLWSMQEIPTLDHELWQNKWQNYCALHYKYLLLGCLQPASPPAASHVSFATETHQPFPCSYKAAMWLDERKKLCVSRKRLFTTWSPWHKAPRTGTTCTLTWIEHIHTHTHLHEHQLNPCDAKLLITEFGIQKKYLKVGKTGVPGKKTTRLTAS